MDFCLPISPPLLSPNMAHKDPKEKASRDIKFRFFSFNNSQKIPDKHSEIFS